MLICADYTIDSKTGGPLKFYHGDFPVIINSDDIVEMYVTAGESYNKGESCFFAVARAKNNNLYRISDIYKIPEDYKKALSVKNPRDRAINDLFDILENLCDGKPYCRKVFLDGGNDQKLFKNIQGGKKHNADAG